MSTTTLGDATAAIDILQYLPADRTPATASQKERLQAWPGWGALAPAFDPDPTPGWSKVHDQILDVLDDDGYRTARECVDNAFHTPAWLATDVWQLLVDAGFNGGRVLEPGCGAGVFLDTCPDQLPVDWVGVESDLTAARICQTLHPDANIHAEPLEDVTLQSGGFDLAVGNVPFSKSHIYDRAVDGAMSMHTYFLYRAIEAVRVGGLIAVITSRHVIDGWTRPDGTRFEAAARLPSGIFPGTHAVADLLVLRKTGRTENWPVSGERISSHWSQRTHIRNQPSPYWEAHPELVAGTLTETANWRAGGWTVTSDTPRPDTRAALTAAGQRIGDYIPPAAPTVAVADTCVLADPDGRQEGSFHLINDVTHQVVDAQLKRVRGGAELRALIGLRDLVVDLLALEADHSLPDRAIDDHRAATREAWEAYVDQWGPLNRGTLHTGRIDDETGMAKLSWRRPRQGGFRIDPDSLLVMAVEDYDPDTDTATAAPILHRRVNKPVPAPTRADSPAEAVAVALAETGLVDLTRIAGLLNLPGPAEAATECGDLIYCDPTAGPTTGGWVRARDYLSGDVRTKLAAAQKAAETNPSFGRNVAALNKVLPRLLSAEDIRATLGAPWIHPDDVAAFLAEVLGGHARVEHCRETASWEISSPPARHTAPAAYSTYGTADLDGFQLVTLALNGKTPVITREEWDPQTRQSHKVRDTAATEAAQEVLTQLQDRFADWVWQDATRADRLVARYNRMFNSHVVRRNDGSHLTFPTMSDHTTLWPWQKDIIDQAVTSPTVFCAHTVGAGKTLSALGTAIMLRQFGLATKPMIAVPNHLLDQIAREALQAFPTARLLVAGTEDLTKNRRRLFAARCATGDWDAVIITHSAFTSIPVSPKVEQAWMDRQKDELDAGMRAAPSHSFSAKRIAARVRGLTARLQALRDSANDAPTITFEQLGVDYLAVDEAHLFKRLPITTSLPGWSFGSSKRATDLLLKIEWLRSPDPHRPHAAFFSGTPFTNTLAEAFVWLKLLAPHRLAEAWIDQFDAFAATFVQFESKVEPAPDGSGLRVAARPTRIINRDELRCMLGSVMDVLSADDIDLERPAADWENITVPANTAQLDFIEQLVARAEALRTNPGGTDNMLAICGDGRRVALDPRLVGLDAASPKVAVAAERVHGLWDAHHNQHLPGTSTPGVLQVVFCDQGTPHAVKGAQTYGRLKQALVDLGIPADQIRYIHEATDDKSKAALFKACRDGSVAVLIASTDKGGMGTNIQTRIAAVHHLDAPWRCSDMQQREGRALRPGNRNKDVKIIRYATEGSFDVFIYATLQRKAATLATIMDPTITAREVDDISDIAVDFQTMTALASGNPLLLEKAELLAQLRRLRTRHTVARQSLHAAQQLLDESRDVTSRLQLRRDRLAVTHQTLQNQHPGPAASTAGHGLAQLVSEAARGAYMPAGTWHELTVKAEQVRHGRLPAELHLYDTTSHRLGTLHVEQKLWRRRPETAAELLHQRLTDWWKTIPDRLTSLDRQLADHQAAVVAARQIVDEWRFAENGELEAVERALAQVTARIESAATDGMQRQAA